MAIRPGTIISGRYKIVEKIGRGGFSVVWKAEQMATGQWVAIKVLRGERIEDEAQRKRAERRFNQEMRLMARISHPNIVRLIDSDHLPDGQYYTVLQYVDGEDLSRLIAASGRLSPAETKRLMLQVLDALSAAHQTGVIHRDLKPQNIVITASGARRNAMVVDFGIATLGEASRGTDYSTVTAANEFPGTVSYMAPEHLRGEEATPQVDLYGWGLVFLECLFGRQIVTGRNTYEIILRHTSPEPLTLPAPLLAHPLGALLAKAVAKRTEERFKDASQLMEALEALDVSDLDLSRVAYEEPPLPPHPGSQPDAASAWSQGSGHAPASTPEVSAATPADPEPLPAALSAPPTTAPLPSERRDVCCLDCGLVWTGDGDADIPLDEGRLLRTVGERWRRLIEQGGGRVEADGPGSLIATFGLPRAGEDDALCAADVALRLTAVLRFLRGDLASAASDYRIQVGLHCGPLVVSGGSVDVHSPRNRTVQTTSALRQLAPAGGVAISPDAACLLRGRFELSPWKGVSTSWGQSFEALMLVGSQGGLSSGELRAGDSSTRFVARTQELLMLRSAWEEAKRSQGRGVLILGDPGIGKSRLVQEMIASLATGSFQHLEVSCARDAQNTALWPITEMLRRAAELPAGAQAIPRLAAWLDELELGDESRAAALAALLIPDEDPPGGADALPPAEQKHRILHAAVEVVRGMARRRPALVLVEDLHWSDPTTLQWIEALLQVLPDSPILLLMTSRPRFKPPWSQEIIPLLELAALAPEEAIRLIEGLTGGRAVPQAILSQIVHRADRIPLYVEEVTRMLLESGALDQPTSTSEGIADALAVPTTVRTSISARLDGLGEPRATALLAAVIGRSFDPDLLHEVSPLSGPTLREHLAALTAARLIQPDPGRNGAYRFRHSMVQETAYDALLKPDRAAAHKAIAEAIQSISPGTVTERPGLLAYHLGAAGEHVPAIQYSVVAARAALARSANLEALSHVMAGLGWLEQLPADAQRDHLEFDLRQLEGTATLHTRGYAAPELASAHQRCRELAPRLSQRADVFPSLWGIWVFNYGAGSLDASLEIARENLAFAEQQGDEGHLLEAHLALSGSLFYIGELAPACDHMRRARDLYRPEHHGHAAIYGQDPGVASRAQLGWNLWFLGYADQATASIEDALELAQSLDHRFSEALARGCASVLYQLMGEIDDARREAEAVMRLGEVHSLSYWRALCSGVFHWARGVSGEDAIADLEAAVQSFRSTGAQMLTPYFAALTADVHLAADRPEEALAAAESGLESAARQNERFYEPELGRLRALALHRVGRELVEVDECLRRAISLARQQESLSLELRLATSAAELHPGDPSMIPSLRRVYRRFTEGHQSPHLCQAQAILTRSAP